MPTCDPNPRYVLRHPRVRVQITLGEAALARRPGLNPEKLPPPVLPARRRQSRLYRARRSFLRRARAAEIRRFPAVSRHLAARAHSPGARGCVIIALRSSLEMWRPDIRWPADPELRRPEIPVFRCPGFPRGFRRRLQTLSAVPVSPNCGSVP